MKALKLKLYQACRVYVAEKQQTNKDAMDDCRVSLLDETKSSAGDKHETGRAMLQLEMEKTSQQLASILQIKEVLEKINPKSVSEFVSMGSLVLTDKFNYYVAIGAGKITVDSQNYFIVSIHSPIGQQLLGKKEGDLIPFNNAVILKVY